VKSHLEAGGTKVPSEYLEFVIQREMGWDYWVYHRQPEWWPEMVAKFMEIESKASLRRRKREELKHRQVRPVK